MEVYINQSMKQVCEEIEAIQSLEDEQFSEELDKEEKMLFTFEPYEGKDFVGTKTINADTELLATNELDIQLKEEGRGHLEYQLLKDEDEVWDPFHGMLCEHCGDPIEEGHDCLMRDERDMLGLDFQLSAEELEEVVWDAYKCEPVEWVKRMFDLEGLV